MVRYKILVFIFSSTFVFGQTHPNAEIDSMLVNGIKQILLENYDNANSIFYSLDTEFKENPLGNIYLAANQIALSVDYNEPINEVYVDSLLDLAKDKTDQLLEVDDKNIWYNYYDALIYGYKAYYHAITGSLISSFADGLLCLRSFQNCLEVDPDFYEAYIALGTYNYWKSAESEAFLWLPFVEDNREIGIEYLKKALSADTYNKHLAAYSLIWIYLDFEQPEKAVDVALKSLKEFKDSRFFLWALARTYRDIDNNLALQTYKKLLMLYETDSSRNLFNVIVLKHKIAMINDELGDYPEALKLCNEILDFEIKSAKIKNRLEDRINRASELKEKLLDKIENSN